jgi:hypothetical protein
MKRIARTKSIRTALALLVTVPIAIAGAWLLMPGSLFVRAPTTPRIEFRHLIPPHRCTGYHAGDELRLYAPRGHVLRLYRNQAVVAECRDAVGRSGCTIDGAGNRLDVILPARGRYTWAVLSLGAPASVSDFDRDAAGDAEASGRMPTFGSFELL